MIVSVLSGDCLGLVLHFPFSPFAFWRQKFLHAFLFHLCVCVCEGGKVCKRMSSSDVTDVIALDGEDEWTWKNEQNVPDLEGWMWKEGIPPPSPSPVTERAIFSSSSLPLCPVLPPCLYSGSYSVSLRWQREHEGE